MDNIILKDFEIVQESIFAKLWCYKQYEVIYENKPL